MTKVMDMDNKNSKKVDGFIMRNEKKGATVKCTLPFRKYWEKMGFVVIYQGKIDVAEWGQTVTEKELKELGFDVEKL